MKDNLGEVISIQNCQHFLVKLAEYWATHDCNAGDKCNSCPLNKPTTLVDSDSGETQTICECLMEVHCEAYTNSKTKEHLYEELNIDTIIKETK